MGIHERKSNLRETAARLTEAGFRYSDDERLKSRTAIRLSMAEYIPDNQTRRKVLGWLWVKDGVEVSTTNLSDAQLKALRLWLQILPTGIQGEFTISEIAAGEVRQMSNMICGILEKAPVVGPVVQAAIELGAEIAEKIEPVKDIYFRCD